MKCCVQASTENVKQLGHNTLFLQWTTEVVTRVILHAYVGITLAQPTEETTTTWNKPRMQIGKTIIHLCASAMPGLMQQALNFCKTLVQSISYP